MSNKEEEVQRCKLAEQAERYEDMVTALKKITESDGELTNEEGNLFMVAYRNMIGARRTSWRVISSIEQKTKEGSEYKYEIIKEYRERIEKELRDICQEVLTLLENVLIPKAVTIESKVFYLKMMSTYNRYLAEVSTGDERQKMIKKTHAYDSDMFELVNTQLPPTHPTRFSLALSYSSFYHDILDEPERACRLAKQAFDDAISELDTINEDSYKESTLIMQLLRDNLTLWTRDATDVDETNPSTAQ